MKYTIILVCCALCIGYGIGVERTEKRLQAEFNECSRYWAKYMICKREHKLEGVE